MKAALYYPWVYVKGGAERVLLELMQRSRHDWTLYTNHFEPDATFAAFKELPVVSLKPISVERSVTRVAQAGVRLVTQRLKLPGQRALLVVSEGLGNLVVARSSVPTYCLCLTPLKIAYDPFTRKQRALSRRSRLAVAAYAAFERPAWSRYRHVFCLSKEVRDRVLRAHLVDADRLEITYPGVDPSHFRPTGEREPFFLVPGRIMWSKNVELAIRAWVRFKPSSGTNVFRLVIAGMVDVKSRPYIEQLRNLAAGRPDIVFVECPADEQLVRLYQRCHAVLFTAPNEDWGLVPLEAMACAKPVIATDRGGPRESILDAETGFLLCDDPTAFAMAIRYLATAPKEELDRMGTGARRRAEEFSWDRFVERIDAKVGGLAEVPVLAAVV
ncbi:MAG: glycosyltransferase family 4 protein [Candidatus Dormibacteraeota bacterium]|nr:glycosyltransferase family 4 protein [Candidatus Dormibacteraeota bacterium]